MSNNFEMDELKAEFDKFVRENCATDINQPGQQNPDAGDKEDDEPVPAFVDEIADKLLAPAKSGAYLSRIDIKRVAEAIDESIPIKERDKMIKALFRHTTKKEYLRQAFDEFNKHLNGRMLIYKELATQFPASASVFEGYSAKIVKTQKMFEQIVNDFEEIEPTSDPMMV